MSSEEFARYIATIVGVFGVGILAITLGGQVGMWAAGAVLLITGSVIGIPLWRRHFEAVENAKTHAQARPEPAPKATEESPY